MAPKSESRATIPIASACSSQAVRSRRLSCCPTEADRYQWPSLPISKPHLSRCIGRRTSRSLTLSGAGITDAYRFWFDNSSVDYGHAMRLVGGSTQEIAFQKREAELQRHAPVLQITYALPQPENRPQFHWGDSDGSGLNDTPIRYACSSTSSSADRIRRASSRPTRTTMRQWTLPMRSACCFIFSWIRTSPRLRDRQVSRAVRTRTRRDRSETSVAKTIATVRNSERTRS